MGIPDPPHFFKQQLSQLGIGLGVGAVFVLSAELGTIGRIVGGTDLLAESPALQLLWRLFVNTTPLMLGIGLLAYIYKYVTDVKVPWRTVLPGAVLAGAMFEAAKVGFVLYLDNFANFDQAYGSVSTVVVLLLWFYVVSVILVFGAEVAARSWRSRPGHAPPAAGDATGVAHAARLALALERIDDQSAWQLGPEVGALARQPNTSSHYVLKQVRGHPLKEEC